MTRSLFKGSLVGIALFAASNLHAQGAPQATRVQGKVAAISASQITLTKADGTTATVPLLPNWTVRAFQTDLHRVRDQARQLSGHHQLRQA